MASLLTRKDFLKSAALALSLPLLPTSVAQARSIKKIGVQLYTVRELMAAQPRETLLKIAQIGYKEIETFNYTNGRYFGFTPREFKKYLRNVGLATPSGHYMPAQIRDEWTKCVDAAAEVGQRYMICSYIMPTERTLEDYKRFIDLFNQAGETCRKAGIQFGYHNHDFEFKTVDGQLPYDLILQGTDPELVKMELDLYWAVLAGQDPVALFEKSPGRFPLVHMKDMAKTEKREFAEVGRGSIDFQRILNAGKTAGLKHVFVEQDITKQPPLEAITISYANVKKLKS